MLGLYLNFSFGGVEHVACELTTGLEKHGFLHCVAASASKQKAFHKLPTPTARCLVR